MRQIQLLEDIRDFHARAIKLRESRTLAEHALTLSYKVLELEVPDTFLGRSMFAPEEKQQ